MQPQIYTQSGALDRQDTAKVLRNTYALLAMTVLFSAVTAGIALALDMGRGMGLICSIAALVLIWFVLPRTANSASGIGVVFAFTGLLGASLGPMLKHYLGLAGGGQIVMQALGTTALIFFALSAYVLTTRKDFSFMGGFLFVGLIGVLVCSLGMVIAGFFGVYMPLASVVLSGVIALLFSGFILFDTSRIIHGGETNYLMATTALYLDILNLFTSLLHIFGFASDD
ncbi:Bax inhibitor-1/YccA family protein [Microbulbifer thermotolerans]|uniref:BAX inhibitor protein n=1 Tax=Microbulbifer thermotolerans TaxID=252514 RepID=A0A143HL86_MICTH|nr:Bax inhibitor-1/YccA family protein [Microbulbifer thermotolerans]AMX02485.1 BAX inhibitor protein [Microbulbifer thermotolerans]MCX2782460.1 Bax inhibitor-1/YccA family protein [Microbulbifer thermotolerans]MCX2795045.1 Bax inhibitor-1/YccA family protein [Microbulbifer thermotolerans]MCX2800613.1 Bax inhibitor-1/YccA family protein [Microbulbifer thermotolerans]MCX2833717.1 Bax inhibitor-1/YccA family protein [Microbulbifer thermotolerans]